MKNKRKAIIIGAGFGGLSLAITLLGNGWNVKIYEKISMPGGHAQQIKSDGFTFDTGPSLITAPEIIENIFSSAGLNYKKYINLIPLNPYYKVIYHDNTYIEYSGNEDDMIRQIGKYNSNDADNYLNYMEFAKNVYDAVIVEGLGGKPFDSVGKMLKFMPKAIKMNALKSSYNATKKYFSDFRTRFIFSFHPLFIGGNPFSVPSIYQMIPYLEKAQGVWYTKGGMRSLVDGFTRAINDLGGIINCNSEVKKINVSNNIAKSIVVNGEEKKGDIIVSNADITYTYKNMLSDSKWTWSDAKIKRNKYSMSAFIIYIGVKKKYDFLRHHTLILSKRYKSLVNDIFKKNIVPEDFSLYLHVPSKTDDTIAPDNCENMYILSPVTNRINNVDWELYKEEYGNRILQYLQNKMGFKGLSDNIIVKQYTTPLDFEKRTNSWLGTPWGLEPRLTQSAYFRPHNSDKNIHNLFIVGAGTHPGAGLPGVMLSAEATYYAIKNKTI